MNEKQENGMIAIAVGVLFIIIALLAFTSCATKRKVVKELEYVHDTLFVSHTDTFMVERWNTRHDTIQMITERVVTLMQNDKSLPAETIRVVNNQRYFEKEIVRDSSASFISKIDSILRAMDRQHEKEKAITKREPPWIERMIFLLAIGIFIYVFLRHRK